MHSRRPCRALVQVVRRLSRDPRSLIPNPRQSWPPSCGPAPWEFQVPRLVQHRSKWPWSLILYIHIRGQFACLYFFCLRRQLVFCWAFVVPQSAPRYRAVALWGASGSATGLPGAVLSLEMRAGRIKQLKGPASSEPPSVSRCCPCSKVVDIFPREAGARDGDVAWRDKIQWRRGRGNSAAAE